MESPSESSISSKNGMPLLHNQAANDKRMAGKQERRWPTADDYRYLATGLLKQRMPKMIKTTPLPRKSADSEVIFYTAIDESQIEKKMKITKSKNENVAIRNLAKEMGRILVNAKSKGHTDELLQLFKSILNSTANKQQLAMSSSEGREANNKTVLAKQTTTSNRQQKSNKNHTVEGPTQEQPSKDRMVKGLTQLPSAVVPVKHKAQPSKISTIDINSFSERNKSGVITKSKRSSYSVIEASKTNVLHRCYGKQSIKVIPPLNKSGKKECNSNCRKPPVVKKRNPPIKAILTKQPPVVSPTNQQMKTIYENNQFYKSNSIAKPILKGPKVAAVIGSRDSKHDCVLVTEVDDPKDEIIVSPKKSQKGLYRNDEIDKISAAAENVLSSAESNFDYIVNESIIDQRGAEQDSSLVHRLTSFWNQKLQDWTEKTTGSEGSSMTSLASVVNPNSETASNIKSNDLFDDELQQFSGTILSVDEIPNNNGSGDGKGVNKKGGRKFPDIKMGLMNELIRVLQRRNPASKPKRADESHAVPHKDDGDKVTTIQTSALSEDDMDSIEEDQYSEYSEDSVIEKDDYRDYQEQCNEETIEAIHTCLMTANENINYDESNDGDCDDDDSTNSTTSATYHSQSDETFNNIPKSPNKNKVDPSKRDNKIVLRKYNEIEGVDESQAILVHHKNTLSETITNVNDIISNLRNLIYMIESIPNEMKTMKIDLKRLPIPDQFKQMISLLIENDVNLRNQNALCYTEPVQHTNEEAINQTDLNNPHKSELNKQPTYKTKGLLSTYYFPSTLTKPTFESVINPILLILYPTRSDYLKSIQSEENVIEQPRSKCQTANDEKFALLKRITTKMHSTVFYVAKSSKVNSTRGTPSSLLPPYQKNISFNNNFIICTKDNDEFDVVEDDKSNTDSIDTRKLSSTTFNYSLNTDNDNDDKIVTVTSSSDVVLTNQDTNIANTNSSNAFSVPEQENNNVNYGIDSATRFNSLTHSNNNNDKISNGGTEDYNEVLAIPSSCHGTSSMSVLVSESPSENESQRNIQLIEISHQLKHPIQHSSDTYSSTPNTEDSANQEQRQEDVETKNPILVSQVNTTNEDTTSEEKSDWNMDVDVVLYSPNVDRIGVRTELAGKGEDTLVKCKVNNEKYCKIIKQEYGTNYIVMYCFVDKPEKVPQVLQETSVKKYDLDGILEQDPELKKKISDVIEIKNLSDNEKKIIAACLMSLKQKNSDIDKSLINATVLILSNMANTVLLNALDHFHGKLLKIKKKLIVKYQSQTKLVECFQYRNLLKIIYTTFVSLMLCFVMQKKFCGVPLPIHFPW